MSHLEPAYISVRVDDLQHGLQEACCRKKGDLLEARKHQASDHTATRMVYIQVEGRWGSCL